VAGAFLSLVTEVVAAIDIVEDVVGDGEVGSKAKERGEAGIS